MMTNKNSICANCCARYGLHHKHDKACPMLASLSTKPMYFSNIFFKAIGSEPSAVGSLMR